MTNLPHDPAPSPPHPAGTRARRVLGWIAAWVIVAAAYSIVRPAPGLRLEIRARTTDSSSPSAGPGRDASASAPPLEVSREPAPRWRDFSQLALRMPGGFEATYSGCLHVRRGGLHHFDVSTTGGGRAWLSIGGAEFAGSVGTGLPGQAMRELPAGLHELRIRYENDPTTDSIPYLNVGWSKDVRAFAPIPPSATLAPGASGARLLGARALLLLSLGLLVATSLELVALRSARAARRAGFALVACGGAILLPLGLSELALRALGIRPRDRVPGSIWLTYRLNEPGSTTRYMGYMPCAIKDFETEVTMNRIGLRDLDRPLEKHPGTTRIAVLGDSYVEGKEVAFERTMTRLLEAELNASPPGAANGREPGDSGATERGRFETMSFGRGGTSTIAQVEQLRSLVSGYSPDVVVLCFFPGNDVRENDAELQAEYERWFEEIYQPKIAASRVAFLDRANVAPRLRLSGVLADRACDWHDANLWRWRGDLTRADMTPGDLEVYRIPPEPSEPHPDPRWNRAWKRGEAEILEARRLAEGAGARFLLVAIHSAQAPGLRADEVLGRDGKRGGGRKGADAPLDLTAPGRRLEAFAREHGIECLNLGPILEADRRTTGEPYYFPHDAHWNERGHEIAARALAERLRESLDGRRAGHLPGIPSLVPSRDARHSRRRQGTEIGACRRSALRADIWPVIARFV